jgi:hypothetical protein
MAEASTSEAVIIQHRVPWYNDRGQWVFVLLAGIAAALAVTGIALAGPEPRLSWWNRMFSLMWAAWLVREVRRTITQVTSIDGRVVEIGGLGWRTSIDDGDRWIIRLRTRWRTNQPVQPFRWTGRVLEVQRAGARTVRRYCVAGQLSDAERIALDTHIAEPEPTFWDGFDIGATPRP